MYQVLIVIHVFLAIGIIGLIMIQQGKGADAGASFGSGASGSVFGSQGAGSFLTRTTAIFATLFFTTSLTLAVIGGNQTGNQDIILEQPPAKKSEAPLIPFFDMGIFDMEKPEQAIPQVPNAKSQASVQDNDTVPSVKEPAQGGKEDKPQEAEKK